MMEVPVYHHTPTSFTRDVNEYMQCVYVYIDMKYRQSFTNEHALRKK